MATITISAWWCRPCQPDEALEGRVGGQVGEVVLHLARGAALAHQPDLRGPGCRTAGLFGQPGGRPGSASGERLEEADAGRDRDNPAEREAGGGSGKNLGRYAASWMAC
jgi:hypothetical protein